MRKAPAWQPLPSMFLRLVYYAVGLVSVGNAAQPSQPGVLDSLGAFEAATAKSEPPAGLHGATSRFMRHESRAVAVPATSLTEAERSSRGELIPGIISPEEEAAAKNGTLLVVQMMASLDVDAKSVRRKSKRTYSIQGGSKFLYCSDHGDNAVKCNQPAIGVWEMFQIFHWSRAPHLHVIKGGNGQKWCRDHGDFLSCNKDVISTTEEFSIQTSGEHKVLRGHERDKWCKVLETGSIACDVQDVTEDPAMVFSFVEIPNAAATSYGKRQRRK
eukprot:TRINITY_DN102668_c0_g1_i1.p1 TRINITY_DN102668_c0_g1~~TRINITY_DN102668_c0_g1_i1.p1  ORF type:complete len:282 (+),score=61.99 TRINITY_DN102668_c0_g1_i1:31-846(+)